MCDGGPVCYFFKEVFPLPHLFDSLLNAVVDCKVKILMEVERRRNIAWSLTTTDRYSAVRHVHQQLLWSLGSQINSDKIRTKFDSAAATQVYITSKANTA